MRNIFVLSVVIALGCASSPSTQVTPDASVDAVIDTVVRDVKIVVDAPVPADASADVATERLRVLFVGNSYIFVNDLPAVVTTISRSVSGRGPVIETGAVTVGGATLRNHWETGTATTEINSGTWNAVVLQGQSVEPVLNSTEFQTYAQRFGTLANSNNVRPVFYATWARREGDVLYMQPWSGGSVSVFTDRLDMAYQQASMRVMGTVARTGVAWRTALSQLPSINLYADDGSHPSPAGTWLVACVIYRNLTGLTVSPEADRTAGSVPAATAQSLREIANASP
jgi:hypothetical protein